MNLNSVKSGLVYFLLVFAVGFALGILRVVVLVPRLGERYAELLELPLMIFVSYIAARYVTGRFDINRMRGGIVTGLVALLLLLLFEFTLVLGLRGLTIGEYFASRDPVSFSAYIVSLVIFGAMPLIVMAARGSGGSNQD